MALYIGSIVVHVMNLDRAVAFWTAALEYVVSGKNADFAVLKDARGPGHWCNLSLQLVDEPKQEPNRLHLDLYADDQAAEIARLEALGATRLGPPFNSAPNPDYVVLADPDGNEFCVVA